MMKEDKQAKKDVNVLELGRTRTSAPIFVTNSVKSQVFHEEFA